MPNYSEPLSVQLSNKDSGFSRFALTVFGAAKDDTVRAQVIATSWFDRLTMTLGVTSAGNSRRRV
jgi:hypothetical protein